MFFTSSISTSFYNSFFGSWFWTILIFFIFLAEIIMAASDMHSLSILPSYWLPSCQSLSTPPITGLKIYSSWGKLVSTSDLGNCRKNTTNHVCFLFLPSMLITYVGHPPYHFVWEDGKLLVVSQCLAGSCNRVLLQGLVAGSCSRVLQQCLVAGYCSRVSSRVL